MCSAIETSIHRGGTLHGQRYLSLGRKAKRDGSCTQNAAEECSCSGSYRFRHCDLLSKPPHKIMTPMRLMHQRPSYWVEFCDRSQKRPRRSGAYVLLLFSDCQTLCCECYCRLGFLKML